MTTAKVRQFRWFFGLGLLAFGCAGCPSANVGGSQDAADDGSADDGDGADGVEAGVEIVIPNEGAAHVSVGQQVSYQTNPPASGPHWSQGGMAPAAAGFYETAVEEEQWVHNLEHGYVVLLYDCRGTCPSTLLNDLQDFFDSAPPSDVFGTTKMVVAAYDGLPFLLTAVAWDRQLHLETLDEATLLDFYDRHVDQGPELSP